MIPAATDGERISSCLTFAVMYQGQEITTIEELASAEELHPARAAFIAHDAFQCGYWQAGIPKPVRGLISCCRRRTDQIQVATVGLTSASITAEIEYLTSQPLRRLGTVNEAGEPRVVPVSFRLNAELDTIAISAHNLGMSQKLGIVAGGLDTDPFYPSSRPVG